MSNSKRKIQTTKLTSFFIKKSKQDDNEIQIALIGASPVVENQISAEIGSYFEAVNTDGQVIAPESSLCVGADVNAANGSDIENCLMKVISV